MKFSGRRVSLVCVVLAVAGGRAVSHAFQNPKEPEGVISLGHSLNVRVRPVPISAVKIPDGFWGNRMRAVTEKSLPGLRQQLDVNGTLDNFLRIAGKKNVPRKGRPASDTDLYKWIEAAAWAIASPDTLVTTKQKFQSDIDVLIPIIAGAQDPSGYLDTNFAGDRAHLRFSDLVHSHEDYCLARLIFAGIAYYRATQNRALLDIGIKFADNVVSAFGPAGKPFVAAHPELIGSFVELYRTVHETKYLDFARYLLSGSERDRLHLKDSEIHYMFSGKPFTSRTELEGQAVNALEAASGATDYFAESGDPPYKRVIDLLWNDLTMRRISISGAAALRDNGDTFGSSYSVATGSSVAEAPSAIANTRWNLRLMALTGDARYADVFENALYNGAAASFSPVGGFSCSHGAPPTNTEKAKNAYYETDTCPPNIPSLFNGLASYFYATGLDGIYVSLFNNSELDWHLEDGTGIRLVQATNYPWDGEIKFTVFPAKPAEFHLNVRWPAWASAVDASINGEKVTGDFKPGTFMTFNRTWQSGDVLTLNFPMQPSVIRANPRADDLWGRAAVERGPLVYTLQQVDQGSVPLLDSFLRANSPGTAEFRKELLGGVTVIKFPGYAADKPLSNEPLYWKDQFVQNRHPVTLVFVPYFTLGTRDSEGAETWVPVVRVPEAPAPPPPVAAPRPTGVH